MVPKDKSNDIGNSDMLKGSCKVKMLPLSEKVEVLDLWGGNYIMMLLKTV